MRPLMSVVALLGVGLTSWAGESPVTVEDSGSKEVDALVAQLVSRRPARYPSGYRPIEDGLMGFARPEGSITPEVATARRKLKQMGPRIFPNLIKHLGDDRYSYSDISAAWCNFDVGHAVIDVLSDGHTMPGGYKWRDTASGSGGSPTFEDYLESRDAAKWAKWASRKSRLEIQMDFIDWCVGKEQERGFTDDKQRRDILDTYQRERERVKKEYTEQSIPAKNSPSRAETKRMSSAARSAR